MRRILIAVPVVLALLVGCGKKAQPPVEVEGQAVSEQPLEQEVLVGAILPETGAIATYGQDTRRGLELAVREANAANRVKIKVVYQDDHSETDKSRDLMRDMVTLQGVKAVIGEVQSSATLKMADIAGAKQVPIITPASTHDEVTVGKPYVFRVCYTDTYQGQTMARFAREELKASRAAVLEEYKSAYSKGLSKSFQAHFKSLGGEIVSVRQFGPDDQDFSAHIDSIRTLRGGPPDVVVIPAYYEPVGKILRQAKEKGLKTKFLGGDGWDSPELYTLAGANAKGHYFADHFSQDDPEARVQEFVKAYREAYPSVGPPTALAALGYDAGLALVDAVNRAQEPTGPGIRDAIAGIRDLRGVTGTITMDAEGNALKDIVILETGTNGARFLKRYEASRAGGIAAGPQSRPSGSR
ncbi:MAG: ABC transporter substrate-binding protein [Planctomycetota bacterium]